MKGAYANRYANLTAVRVGCAKSNPMCLFCTRRATILVLRKDGGLSYRSCGACFRIVEAQAEDRNPWEHDGRCNGEARGS
jgi:hypothetical protein